MARVTVEDCAKVVHSRFELVALAAQRAKLIASGNEITVDRKNDKNPVVALREIAEETVSVDKLRQLVIQSCQTRVKTDIYGIEEAVSGEEVGLSSDDIVEDIESYQENEDASNDATLLYGDDNMDVIED